MADTFVKPPFYLSARYLNDVNDSLQGGLIQALPSSVNASQFQQNIPGDRIILDDATALALSDTTVGTLYGGIYMYVNTLSSSTASPARGTACFYTAASIGGANPAYQFTADANPTTAIPTFFAGVFINAITKGNLGWIQIAGIASCLFDSALTATANGNWVSVKVSSAVASCFDCGAVVGVVTLSALVGTAVTLPAVSTISQVAIWRGFGRI